MSEIYTLDAINNDLSDIYQKKKKLYNYHLDNINKLSILIQSLSNIFNNNTDNPLTINSYLQPLYIKCKNLYEEYFNSVKMYRNDYMMYYKSKFKPLYLQYCLNLRDMKLYLNQIQISLKVTYEQAEEKKLNEINNDESSSSLFDVMNHKLQQITGNTLHDNIEKVITQIQSYMKMKYTTFIIYNQLHHNLIPIIFDKFLQNENVLCEIYEKVINSLQNLSAAEKESEKGESATNQQHIQLIQLIQVKQQKYNSRNVFQIHQKMSEIFQYDLNVTIDDIKMEIYSRNSITSQLGQSLEKIMQQQQVRAADDIPGEALDAPNGTNLMYPVGHLMYLIPYTS